MFYAFNIPEFDGYLLGNFFLALGTFRFILSSELRDLSLIPVYPLDP